MMLAQKIALDTHNAQDTSFRRAAGTARKAYNGALAPCNGQYAAWQTDAGGYPERAPNGHHPINKNWWMT